MGRLIQLRTQGDNVNLHPKGCILCGPHGCCRSFLSRYVADQLKMRYIEIDAEPIPSTTITIKVLQNPIPQNSIVFLRNFDVRLSIISSQGSISDLKTPGSSFANRLLSQLCDLIDRSKAFFILSASSIEDIPASLSTSRRLGSTLTIPPISSTDVRQICNFSFINQNNSTNSQLVKSSQNSQTSQTNSNLKEEKKEFSEKDIEEIISIGVTAGVLIEAKLTGDHSGLYSRDAASIIGTVTPTSWDDIGGLSETKAIIREAVEWPLSRAEELKEFGVKPPKGVLLYGPPGCGKTLIAKAVATSLKSGFFSISAAAVYQMYLGESERVVRELFALARQKAPAVIFVDEIDAIVGKRGEETGVSERVLSTFLNEMDGINTLQEVIVIGATNRVDAIDDALLRQGRFDCLIEVKPCQNLDDIKEVLKVCTKKMPLEDNVLDIIAEKIPLGSSGAEIDNLCREAALVALNQQKEKISVDHFLINML